MCKITIFNCICQNCNKFFNTNKFIHNVINIDSDTEIAGKLKNSFLNLVECTHCHTSFCYETPMIIFSQKEKLAIRVNPAIDADGYNVIHTVPEYIIPIGFTYREVAFLIEAREKLNIFRDNLNDKLIEHIKLTMFDDIDALPFNDVNIIYDSNDKHNYYFLKFDSNNTLIDNYCIPKSSVDCNIKFIEDRQNGLWNIINRLTIKNYIQKEK